MIPFGGGQALKALTPQTAVRVDRSRCVRHRCHRNECDRCLLVCPTEAIHWGDQGLQLTVDLCRQCLSCLAACPGAALQAPEVRLPALLADLAAQPQPVLGCHRQPSAAAHARLPCLGYLANPELLLLLALVFREGLQLNLSCCENCMNGSVCGGIRDALGQVAEIGIDHQVQLVNDPQHLTYQPATMTRRELLGFLRKRSKRTAVLMVERLQDGSKAQSYGSKQVPVIRAMLLKALASLAEYQREAVAHLLFGHISFTDTCTGCGGCVGVCPSGAIEPAQASGRHPEFDARKCLACGSCQAFCRKEGVSLLPGAGPPRPAAPRATA